jgi:hypothetical protein
MKFLQEWKELLFIIGAAIAWLTAQYWRSIERKDKKIKDNFHEMKVIKRLELTNRAHEINLQLNQTSFEAMNNEVHIKKGLLNFCYLHNACYSQLVKLHDGGQHISEWSKKLVTMVAEERLPNVEETKSKWQGVPLLQQLKQMMELAFTSPKQYVYYSNYKESMPDGEFKNLIDITYCHDFAIFFSGCAGSEIFFTMFQFRKNGVQSEREKIEIKQFSQSSGIKLFDSYIAQETLKKRLIEIEDQIIEVEDSQPEKK